MNAKQRRKQMREVRRLITIDKLVALRVQQVGIDGVYAFIRELTPNTPWRTRMHLAAEITHRLGIVKVSVQPTPRVFRPS